MNKTKLYRYRNTTSERFEGPFLEEQIQHMVLSGLLTANAEICDQDGVEYATQYFLNTDFNSVSIRAVEVSFGQAVEICFKWILAILPAVFLVGFLLSAILAILGISLNEIFR